MEQERQRPYGKGWLTMGDHFYRAWVSLPDRIAIRVGEDMRREGATGPGGIFRRIIMAHYAEQDRLSEASDYRERVARLREQTE